MKARRLRVRGVVQGVGFRPFVWGLARDARLRGWVRNDAEGVDIRVEGDAAALLEFEARLAGDAPPLARVERVEGRDVAPRHADGFSIRASRRGARGRLPVSPDVAACDACLAEMRDPKDRRHRHPFVNCTDCGPRFTIQRDVPYDRARTTMAGFEMCAACQREYEDPADRRFHAQPVACPRCGPTLWLEQGGARVAEREEAVEGARRLMAEGGILALKGLGGFHLACDACSEGAVATLRARKAREEKPLALMVADLEAARRLVHLSDAAARLLTSRRRPIVLLPAREATRLASSVAPGRSRLGLMLPYTPLHHLLLERADGMPEALVMTSGNVSDEPIAYLDEDARQRLAPLADALLLHDRPIHVRTDDSVMDLFCGAVYPVRRARGYAPDPVELPFEAPPLLAVGGDLKNAYALAKGRTVYLGPHVGDLAYAANLEAFEEGVRHLERLFDVPPQLVAHDLHPDYQSTRLAERRAGAANLPMTAVQHHHAHVASVMAEHGLPEDARVLGVALDGTGHGLDGTIWGGELLLAGYRDFARVGHLLEIALPGGDAAARSPWRSALAWLEAAGVPWREDLPPVRHAPPGQRRILARLLRGTFDAPRTSSTGRLFDAVSALLGLCLESRYEGQAPAELEAVAMEPGGPSYPVAWRDGVLDPRAALRRIVDEMRAGVPPSRISARFHRGLAEALVAACVDLGQRQGVSRVALSGGVWQNATLLALAAEGLERAGLHVLVHRRVPTNDGGLALGQVAVAAARARAGRQTVCTAAAESNGKGG